LLVDLSKFAQCELGLRFRFEMILCLTGSGDFGNFEKFAPKRRSLQHKQTKSALRIKFEDILNFGSGLDPRVSLRRVALKDL
jgi:hypothetical protein